MPYQHFTNGIENFFSILKNKLQKEENITYNNIKRNITKIIRIIPKNIFYNIMKGTYSRNIKYIKKIGILNVQRCNTISYLIPIYKIFNII